MRRPRLLFVVTEDRYFISHRLPLAMAARDAGYEVLVATRVKNDGETIRNAGIKLIPFELSRRGGNPVVEIAKLVRLYRKERPTIVHHVALKAVLYGTVAAKLTGVRRIVNAVTGLGWLFISNSFLARIARPIVRFMLGHLLALQRSWTIVQNPDDLSLLVQAGVPERRLCLIRGAGVDTNLYFPGTDNPMPVLVILVARMLWDKGVGEFVTAAQKLYAEGFNARFVLVGDVDPDNPASIPIATLQAWNGHMGVEWWGGQKNIPKILHQAHIACLPSYREGLPKSLLEAAACGLPIVTTDTSGCREVVRNCENGYLVPLKNANSLATALKNLICNAELRKSMGAKSREYALKYFSQKKIIHETLNLYQKMLE